jgi:hypothetical protein
VKVAEFHALFKIVPDAASMRATRSAISSVRGMLLGLGTMLGARSLGKAMLGFNASMEDSRNQLAGMLSLARKTDLQDQLGDAAKLYDRLKLRAAELPGQTADYVAMLGMLVQPLANAKTSLEDMETITVNSMVAARGFGEGWQKAGRDISEFINFGKMNAVDTFIRRLMEPLGWTQANKGKLKEMTQEQRRALYLQAITQRQIMQLGEAQAKSFSGRVDKISDSLKTFLGRVGKPLFEALGESIARANKWLDEHKDAVERVADTVGGYVVEAFRVLRDVLAWLVDHGDLVLDVLKGVAVTMGVIAARSVLAALPFLWLVARVTALVKLFELLRDKIGAVGAVIATAFGAALMFNIAGITKKVWGLVVALRAMRMAQAGAPAVAKGASAASAASKGASAGMGAAAFLGPIGLAAALTAGILEFGDAITTDEERVNAQAVADLMKSNQGMSMWSAWDSVKKSKAAGGGASATTNIAQGDINLIVNGANMKPDDLERMVTELQEKQLRHLQNNVAGSKR